MKLSQKHVRGWQQLGQPPPAELADARVQLHWAAQIVAAAGLSFVEPQADDSHTSMVWLAGPGLLAGRLTSGQKPFQAALRLRDLTLLLLAETGEVIEEFVLAGRTLEDGYAWLASAVAKFTGGEPTAAIQRSVYELPTHPVAAGAPFALQPRAAFEELERWYANADLVLRAVQKTVPNASPVRCWPHHFDIATLLPLDAGDDPQSARSMGVGLAPGDDFYPEPYWYVSPWPHPKSYELTPLEGRGDWQTENAFMAALPASKLAVSRTAESQVSQVAAFLRSAIKACGGLLGQSGSA